MNTGNYFSGPGGHFTELKYHQFQLNCVSDFFSLFGFVVYLEFIVLKCCGLDYNIKKSIRERSLKEIEENNIVNDEEQGENDNLNDREKYFSINEIEVDDNNNN